MERLNPLFSVNPKDTLNVPAKLQALHTAIDGSAMVDHEQLPGDLVKVSYTNGTVVYVNYSKADCTADGETVPALGYLVKGGDAQ